MSQLFLENFSHFIQWKKTANERKCYIWSCILDIQCWLLNIIWTSLFDCWTQVSHQPWAVRVCSLLRLVDKLWGWNTAMQLFQIILILYLVNCVTFGSSIWKCMKMHLRLLTSLNTHAYTNAYIDVLTYIYETLYTWKWHLSLTTCCAPLWLIRNPLCRTNKIVNASHI